MRHFVFLTNVPERFKWGGCEQLLLDYFKYVDFSEGRITVAVTQDVFTERLKENNLPIRVAAYPFEFNGDFKRRFLRMHGFLKSLSPDGVVFVQNDFMKFRLSEFLAARLAARGNVYSLEVLGAPEPKRPAYRMHFKVIPGMAIRWRTRQAALMLRGWLCRVVVACSEEVKRRVVQWYHYPRNRVVSLYQGIDVNKFCPDMKVRQRMRADFAITEKDTVIISTARFAAQKCIDRLINAFDNVAGERKDCHLILVGDGPLRDSLEDLAKQKKCRDRIHFLGFRNDVADLLKMSDVFVLPSDNEGLARSVLEAMAAGLVCVVTNAAGAAEVINGGENGFLVDCSETGVVNGLERVLGLTDSRRMEMINAGRRIVQDKFNQEVGLRRTLETIGLSCRAGRAERVLRA